MSDYVLLDEYHLSIRVPTDLDHDVCEAICRILESRRFRTALRRAVSEVIRQCPELAPVRVRISV
jgi:hypothetical protein